jgi:hypothetical protein
MRTLYGLFVSLSPLAMYVLKALLDFESKRWWAFWNMKNEIGEGDANMT